MGIDYNTVTNEFVKRGSDRAILASIGYIHTNIDICEYQSFNILNQMKEVDHLLNDEQKENITKLYNKLIV